VRQDTRLVYLCNPNNPTGTTFDDHVLAAILDGLPEWVKLIYDEVYYHFATGFDLPDAQKYVREGRNIIVIHSFSKAYGLAGLRLGYAIAPVALAARIAAVKRRSHISSVGISAAKAALGDAAHLRLTVDNNTAERAKVEASIQALGLTAAPSQANFLMCRCPHGVSASELTAALLDQGVLVRPAFDLDGHIRVTVGKPADNDLFLSLLTRLS
jgi:histidinol-phosphate aminotransferase